MKVIYLQINKKTKRVNYVILCFKMLLINTYTKIAKMRSFEERNNLTSQKGSMTMVFESTAKEPFE